MNKPTGPDDPDRTDDQAAFTAKWTELVSSRQGSKVAVQSNPQTLEPPSSPTFLPDPDWLEPVENPSSPSSSSSRSWIVMGIAAILWLLFAGVTLVPGLLPPFGVSLLQTAAAIVTPLLLLGLFAMFLRFSRRDAASDWAAHASEVSTQAQEATQRLAEAEAGLDRAYAALERQARDASAIAETSAEALLVSARRIETESAKAESGLRASGVAAAETLSLVEAIETSAPRLSDRLSDLSGTLAASSTQLAERGKVLEEGLRGASVAAEEMRLQLTQAQDAAGAQLATLRTASREAGDDLTAMAELASARVELVLERARTAMAYAKEGLECHRTALEALGDQGERSGAHIESLSAAIDSIGTRLAAMEETADKSKGRVQSRLATLGKEADRINDALERSNDGAAQLLARAETLLLAIDSNIREIDESLPAALGRFDERLSTTEARLGGAATLAESMAGTADTAARHLEQASDALTAQVQAVEATVSAGDASLARQTAEIATMRSALEESAQLLVKMVSEAVPQLNRTMEAMRAGAAAAAQQAEEAIQAISTRAAEALAQAGGAALDAAVNDKVNAQIAQIAEIADNAVKSAHRATDHLMREMMAITDTATDLEERMARSRAAAAARGRDHLTERSAQIIAVLNDSAIDITRGLSQDIGQKDWASYLNGDKSLFARRAVKLLNSGDLKLIHSRYDIDALFREHVNRYVEDFEGMLSEVLEGPRGHSLAIALLSSDLGRLYVALAQAIERLRVA